METTTFANGCFWCTEAIFQRLKGVTKVTSGYTSHAEALKIEFDPAIISYATLLEVFFATHDPTTLNRQGSDIPTKLRFASLERVPVENYRLVRCSAPDRVGTSV